MADEIQADVTTLTVQLLSAFLSNNSLPAEGLSDLIRSTRAALMAKPVTLDAAPEGKIHKPAVSVRKSLSSPDHIFSLIDGKPYKALKRHLASHGLTPDQYRERYSLPKSYPMVAVSYSEARRAVAARLGLGKRPTVAAATESGASVTAQPIAATLKPKASKATPNTAASAPAKKQRPKAKAVATPPASVQETPVTAAAEPSPTQKGPRKRLSLALQAADAEGGLAKAAKIKAPSKVVASTKTAPMKKSAKGGAKASVTQPSADAPAADLPKTE